MFFIGQSTFHVEMKFIKKRFTRDSSDLENYLEDEPLIHKKKRTCCTRKVVILSLCSCLSFIFCVFVALGLPPTIVTLLLFSNCEMETVSIQQQGVMNFCN